MADYGKLNPEFKKLWVEDLRTTTAPQATDVLWDQDPEKGGFCCLGRAATILANLYPSCCHWDGNVFVYNGDDGEVVLPEDAMADIGLTWDAQDQCTLLNDGRRARMDEPDVKRHTFAEIADWIEENL